MSSQYNYQKAEPTSPELKDGVAESIQRFNDSKAALLRHYDQLQEMVITQQNEIAKLRREVSRLKSDISTLTEAVRRRG